MAKIEPFEIHTAQYENWFEHNKFVYESELQAVRKLLPATGKGTEIGVGTGRFAAPLGIKIGIEPSPKMGEIGRKRHVKIINAIAEKLPLKNSQFDFVLMVTVICFLDNVSAALEEAYRILKPGGCLLIGFVDKDSFLGKIYEQHKNENEFYKIAAFFAVKDVVSYIQNAGFSDNVKYTQTIYHGLPEVNGIDLSTEGFGEGAFVVIKALKKH